MSFLRLSKTGSLDSKGSSGVRTATITEMAAGGATITSATADCVGSTAELLDLVGGQTRKRLTLQWVAKQNSTGDVGSRDAVAESIVNDHATLAVSRDDDLGTGALLERLLDILSHHFSTIGTQIGVTLI